MTKSLTCWEKYKGIKIGRDIPVVEDVAGTKAQRKGNKRVLCLS